MSLAFASMSWQRQVRGLSLVAAALFLVTIAIGLLNGLDLVDFSTADMRPALLTHVHAGTVGLITLGILATTIWYFRSGDGRLSLYYMISVPLYVAAFYSGNLPAGPSSACSCSRRSSGCSSGSSRRRWPSAAWPPWRSPSA